MKNWITRGEIVVAEKMIITIAEGKVIAAEPKESKKRRKSLAMA